MGKDAEGYYFPDPDPQGIIEPYREAEAPPDDNTFEIALVMAGAISAGCYTAGVLDFLFEALDAWENEKLKPDSSIPRHKVRVRVIAGASAGSMNAAIAAGALRYKYPPLRPGMDPGLLNNPFYSGWVKDIDINKLLTVDDLEQSGVVKSLLNCDVLQAITNKALDYSAEVTERAWLHERVRYIFTQTSLQGIPYFFPITGNSTAGQAMTLHKTWSSFSVGYQANKPIKRRPDDVVLDPSFVKKTAIASWVELGNAALASGAFPLALAPRYEKRNPQTLSYRFVTTTAPESNEVKIRQLFPEWDSHPPVPLSVNEYIVDGGVMDNEPMELARKEMAGLACSNPRDGISARRAVIMIDPFPQSAKSGREEPPAPFTILNSITGLFSAAFEQLRFNPDDLALAMDEKVYSRYLIAPVRSEDGNRREPDNTAIASGSLGGFGGFLSEEYRHHDYTLGRRNCQQFLREYFSLPQGNRLFLAGDRHVPTGKGEYPLIPLAASVQPQEPLPAWPTAPVDLEQLTERIDKRLKCIVRTFSKTYKASVLMSGMLRFVIVPILRRPLIGQIKAYISKDLDKKQLPWF
ncbi:MULTISPECIES: patatin-like phospholipase family protein [Enterobacterales]|uniref:patatin-like phospholipase family protein n=1 Tax=Enterobacterales TaxID=91347 RepID=UPI002EDB0681